MKTLAAWLDEGPFTLALSSSFFGFYAHGGFVRALEELGVRPAKVTGSSAGALVAGAIASGLSSTEIRDVLFAIQKDDFWDPGLGLGFLKGQKFHNHLKSFFVPTFEQASLPIEVAVFDVLALKTKFLCQGPLIPAVVASCAVPIMFHPVKIDGRVYLDGGIFNKAGLNEDSNERTLCVYLNADGATGWYERRTHFVSQKTNHKILRFSQFPRVSYSSLERGPQAFDQIYQRSQRAFGSDSRNYVIEA